MNTRRSKVISRALFGLFLSALLLVVSVPMAQAGNEKDKDKAKESGAKGRTKDLSGLPPEVAKAFQTRFPGAKLEKWTQETEDGAEIYDFEFSKGGRKLEADLKADGSILNWEEELKKGDLPEQARTAVETEYPGAIWKQVMQVNKVDQGKDVVEGYEILMEMLDSAHVEVMVDPNGKILEDSGKDD